jgi:hypothetical protein
MDPVLFMNMFGDYWSPSAKTSTLSEHGVCRHCGYSVSEDMYSMFMIILNAYKYSTNICVQWPSRKSKTEGKKEKY